MDSGGGNRRDGGDIDALEKALASKDGDTVLNAVRALRRKGGPRAVNLLVRMIGHGHAGVTDMAVSALMAKGEEAVEPLCRVLRAPYAVTREESEKYLAEFAALEGEKSGGGEGIDIDGLLEVLEKDAKSGGPGTGPSPADVVPREEDDPSGTGGLPITVDRKLYAARILGEIGDRKAAGALREALGDENDTVKKEAARALGKLKDPSAVEVLVSCLGDRGRYSLWEDAVTALGKIGDARAVRPLIALQKEDIPFPRRIIIEAMQRIGPAAGEELLELLREDDEHGRIESCLMLGHIGYGEAEGPITDILADARWKVRYAAVRALEEIGGKEVLFPLKKLFDDPSEHVRDAAREVFKGILSK